MTPVCLRAVGGPEADGGNAGPQGWGLAIRRLGHPPGNVVRPAVQGAGQQGGDCGPRQETAKREKSPRVSPAVAANCCACWPAVSQACSAFRAVADANCWPASCTEPATPARPPVVAPAVRGLVPAPCPRSPALAMMHLLTVM